MNVFEYLISQPKNTLDELFEDSWSCQAIFRSLNGLAKTIIFRLLYVESPQPLNSVLLWTKPDEPKHKSALDRLFALRILEQKGQERLIYLNSKFRKQMQGSLCQTEINSLKEIEDQLSKRTEEEIDFHSRSRWEAIMSFMIGTPTEPPLEIIVDLLIRLDLMQLDENETLKITENGFQFILKDTYTQMWTLLLAYLDTVENRGVERKNVLSFIFQLSFLHFGKGYSNTSLSKTQLDLLLELEEFGIVQNIGKSVFYPTRLAIMLSTIRSTKESFNEGIGVGFIVLESNYRLYAYSTSNLQISILSLFTKLNYRLPNLVVGLITRESIRSALMKGISAEQIIRYMEQNAHEQMKKNTPILPETISDQIRIWESERNRVKYDHGVLYDTFPSLSAFEKVLRYSQDIGVHIWSNKQKQLLMVTQDGHELVKPFIKKNISTS